MILADLVNNDQYRLNLLKALQKIGEEELWIAGGFVRNLVWDYLHEYSVPTKLDDIDVFFYNKNKTSKEWEKTILNNLKSIFPDANWSVKNQARMHLHSGDPQYHNLEEALSKFPETASAVAIKLDKGNKLQILSPLGLNDLFELKIRPTPDCKTNPMTYSRYLLRQKEKDWKKRWPRLQSNNN
jgi:hypothetical protein